MKEPDLVSDIIEQCALLFPDKPAFINRSGSSYSFAELHRDSRFLACELLGLGLSGRPVALMGEVGYGTLAAMFGCLGAGCPVVFLGCGLGEDEQKRILTEYEISALFYGAKYRERAEALKKRLDGVYMFPDVEKQLLETEDKPCGELPAVDASAPAFLFFAADGRGVMLSHKNICASLEAIARAEDISSYTFLSPPVWNDAFDCVIGILFPLSQGCSLIKRGEKRSVARAISESGAEALTCTPARLRQLERSLKVRREKQTGKAGIALSNLCGRLLGFMGADLNKRVHRKVHKLMGDNLKLIICGGAFPDKENIRRFLEWGFTVKDCYFTPECGPLAISDPSNKKMLPIGDISIPSPIKDGFGEICVSGERIPIGYFGGKTDFDGCFPTGDIGRFCEDGSIEIRGRRKTLLYDRSGEMIFPEELASILCRSRYIADCTVTGCFDTRACAVIVTAHIIPDYKEVNRVLGEKYSDNRLRLFFNRVMEKAASELPHKVHEFKLP